MSFRFHRGPTLITVFHDARSPASSRILSLLRSRITPDAPDPSSSSSPAGGAAYLANAARAPDSSGSLQDVELEIKDRSTEPPTSDQWGTILSYLRDQPSDHEPATHEAAQEAPADAAQSIQAKQQQTPDPTDPPSTDFARAALEGTQESGSFAAAVAGPSRSLQEGPLVVNWADGMAVTTEKGVERMLSELEKHSGQSSGDGGSCIVC